MTHDRLDRAVWQALTGRQASVARRQGKALRYADDVSLFAAMEEDIPEARRDLVSLISPGGQIVLLQPGPHVMPEGTEAVLLTEGVQMVLERPVPPLIMSGAVELGDGDAAEMLALAQITKPGPFLPRTHVLGTFYGVREQGRLVAMAGERIRLDGYSEVSGVGTHPDHRGKGYARLLSQLVAGQILARGEVPFLHAFADNKTAITLYESLGFRVRRNVSVTILRKR